MNRKIILLSGGLAFISIVLNVYTHLTVVKNNEWLMAVLLNDPVSFFNHWKLPYIWSVLSLTLWGISFVGWRAKLPHCNVAARAVFAQLLLGLQVLSSFWVLKTQGMPLAVTVEVLLGFSLFWTLVKLYLRTNPALTPRIPQLPIRYFTYIGGIFLLMEIVLGVWSSSNSFSLMCADFPRCNDQWIPQGDFINGLNLLSGIFENYLGGLSSDAKLAIHWLHRVLGFLTFFVLISVMFIATAPHQLKPIRRAGLLLSILLLIELGLGTFSIKLALPTWIVLAHNSFAALLMLPLIAISVYSRYAIIETQVLAPEKDDSNALPEKSLPIAEASNDRLYLRLTSQLKKTRSGLGGILTSLPLGQKNLSEDLLEEIEARLLLADIGVDLTMVIIEQLTESLNASQLQNSEVLLATLKQDLLDILQPCNQPLVIPKQDDPFVILVIGVNGAGKTTTIGKLAKKLQIQGHSVMLAAGDTFRAAAVEQLQVWGERNKVAVIAQQTGADSASVIFDALQSAKAKGIDVLIADTAGRLHTKSNLMDELLKIKRIMGKLDAAAPHEVLLVLDAGTGQNALSQATLFNQTMTLTGLTLTKLDGTAKGGIIFALAKKLGIPIRHIGIGETIDDLQDFNAEQFVDALFTTDESGEC
jgi:fused signal recognition particle receptor